MYEMESPKDHGPVGQNTAKNPIPSSHSSPNGHHMNYQYSDQYEGPVASSRQEENSEAVAITNRKVFIGGLNYETTPDKLENIMNAEYGSVESVEIISDRYTGLSRGFGFIIFSDAAVVDKLVRESNIIVDGNRVEIRRAQPKGSSHRHAPALQVRPDSHPRKYAATGASPNGAVVGGKIFVGGLSFSTTEEELTKYFSQFGPVATAEIMINKATDQPRGFGFVTFESPDDAPLTVGRHPTLGKSVEVKLALPKVDTNQAHSTPYPYSHGAARSIPYGHHQGYAGSMPEISPHAAPYSAHTPMYQYEPRSYRDDYSAPPAYSYGSISPGGPVRAHSPMNVEMRGGPYGAPSPHHSQNGHAGGGYATFSGGYSSGATNYNSVPKQRAAPMHAGYSPHDDGNPYPPSTTYSGGPQQQSTKPNYPPRTSNYAPPHGSHLAAGSSGMSSSPAQRGSASPFVSYGGDYQQGSRVPRGAGGAGSAGTGMY